MGGSSKKQTVGYQYYLGEHLVFVHGPVDKFSRLTFDGNRVAWGGTSFAGVTSQGEILVNAPYLFGGEDIGKEGGVSGVIDFEPGEPTQLQNAYLQAKLGADIPAFRGVTALVFKQVYLGTSAYLKKVSARFTRIRKTTNGATQWYPEKAAVPPLGGQTELFVGNFDVNAVTNGGANPTAGLAVAVNIPYVFDPSDVVIVRPNLGNFFDPPTFVAMSPWGQPDFIPGEPNSGAYLRYSVIKDNNTSTVEDFANSTKQDGYEAARAQFISEYPNGAGFTGASNYKFYIEDTPVVDNTGGVSLAVTVIPALDMNPAHIIRECLTDNLWGMGYNAADIDDVAFAAAADTLFDERMGISILWDQQMPIEEFIKEIIKHIDASLYVDRATGKFVLTLIRGDYDINTIPLFDESNIDKVENFQRPTLGELVNSVTVTYWDSLTGQKGSLTVEDPALVLMQGGVISTTLQYPGFTNSSITSRVGSRDLRTLSNPLASCTITANSEAEDLNIGKVFRFSWAEYGIVNMPMRITGIAFGDGVSNKVKMQVAQDVFVLPETGVIVPPDTGWTDPNEPPAPSPYRVAIELPYVELLQQDLQGVLATVPEAGYAGIAVSRPSATAINSRFMVDSGAGYEEVGTIDFCPIAVLDEDIDQQQTIFDIVGGIDLDLVELGTWCQIDAELCIIVALSSSSITVERGSLDTTPDLHLTGAAIFFWDSYMQNDSTQYVLSDTLNMQALTVTGQGQLDPAFAPIDTLEIVARAIKPYPPGNLIVDGVAYPTDVDFDFNITWSHRDRVGQGDTLVGTTETDIGPEAGTSYTIRLYLDAVLDDEITGITDNFYNGAALSANGVARVEVWSVRAGYESFQPLWAEFDYIGQIELTDDLPDWALGFAFSHTVPFSGGVAPIVWTIESGFLPDGLTLNSSTGAITGTPTVAGVFEFVLRATDDNSLFDELLISQQIHEDENFANVLLLFDATTKADGTAGIIDESNSARTLTPAGNATILNQALELDGTNDWVTAPDHIDWRFDNAGGGTNVNFTMEFFGVIFDASGGSTNGTAQALLSQYDAFSPFTDQRVWRLSHGGVGPSIGMSISTAGTSGTLATAVNFNWTPVVGQSYDIALSRTGTTYSLYIDGVRVAQTTTAGVFFNGTSPLAIGGANTRSGTSADSDDFDGRIKAVRVTKVSRTSDASYVVPSLPLPRGTFYTMVTEDGSEQEVTEEGELNLKENPKNA